MTKLIKRPYSNMHMTGVDKMVDTSMPSKQSEHSPRQPSKILKLSPYAQETSCTGQASLSLLVSSSQKTFLEIKKREMHSFPCRGHWVLHIKPLHTRESIPLKK